MVNVMTTKILVTGGAGYIGSVLVPELLHSGYSVTVIDNFMYGQNSLAQVFRNKNFHIINADVRNIQNYESILKTFDVVVPLAAIVGAPACARNPKLATSTNKKAVIDLLDKLSPNQWVIMPTTNSGYGTSKPGEFLDETSPLNPLSLYARDKVQLESTLMQRNKATSFRLATVFGMSPRMRLDLLVNNFVKCAISPGYIVLYEANFRRNYIHVLDVARALLFALQNDQLFQGQVFNVGLSSANLTKLELAEQVKRFFPKFTIIESSTDSDPDKRDYSISNLKLEKTGFQMSLTIEEGIKELAKGLSTLSWERYSNV